MKSHNLPMTNSLLLLLPVLLSLFATGCFGFDFNSIIDKGPVCYKGYGCFEKFPLSKEWKLPALFNFYPQTPEQIDVNFHMFTCEQKFTPAVVPHNATKAQWSNAPFDPKKRTVVVVHGFRDLFSEVNWMGELKDFLLNEKPCRYNVIGVDWHHGSQISSYMQAVANTQLVGAVIARLINRLNRMYNTTPDHFTLVGHSLGSHVCGFAGKRFNKTNNQIRNIIGLDPAGPAFSDVSDNNRLSPKDARLVLTIHTNGGKVIGEAFGISIPLGHYSFFPNGGENQPGCEKAQGVSNILLNGLVTGLTDTVACSHRRATTLIRMNSSNLEEYVSMAYKCDDYETFTKGKCGKCSDKLDECKPFGQWFNYWQEQNPPTNTNSVGPMKYYIETNKEIPFGLFHYAVKVEFGEEFKDIDGKIVVKLTGKYRSDYQETVTIKRMFKAGTSVFELVKVSKDLNRIQEAEATFYQDGEFNLKGNIVVKSISVQYMTNPSQRNRTKFSSVLVSNLGFAKLNHGKSQKFYAPPN